MSAVENDTIGKQTVSQNSTIVKAKQGAVSRYKAL